MCQEKKEEEDIPESKIALTHKYNSKTTEKSAEEDWFSHQKQYGQHEDQQNGNNSKTKKKKEEK